MKLVKYPMFFAFAIVGLFACSKEAIVPTPIEDVVITYNENLSKGVDSIQTITPNDYRYSRIVEHFAKENDIDYGLVSLWHYNNHKSAILVGNLNQDKVCVYLYDTNTNEFITSYIANLNLSNTKSEIRKSIKVVNFATNELLIDYTFGNAVITKSWGGCMEESMGSLYNDWSNDGWGTMSCWVTGYFCAVGAGIYCLL